MRILWSVGLIGMLLSATALARTVGDEQARAIAEQTLDEGALITRIAPVTAHHDYKRAHEPWQPHSQVKLRSNFTPELQKSVAQLPE